MFTGFSVVSVTELVLGSNENIDNVQRLQWNVEEGEWVELGVCMFACAHQL